MSELELASINATGHSGHKLLVGGIFLSFCRGILVAQLLCGSSAVLDLFAGASGCSSCFSNTYNFLVSGTGMTGFFSCSEMRSLTL